MHHSKQKTQLTATLMIAGLFLAHTPLSSEVTEFVDYCKDQTADYILYVPSQFPTSTKITSGSGFYAYGERGCKYFIADIKMATYSHTNQWYPRPMLYDAGPYDLPSSASFGGTIPSTPEDCGRWTVEMKVYTMMHDEASFTWRATKKYEGVWSSGTCNLVKKSGSGSFPPAINPSTSGWDTYRILIRTKLRTTYQEVAVTFAELPPG